jgi:hypothetical protein
MSAFEEGTVSPNSKKDVWSRRRLTEQTCSSETRVGRPELSVILSVECWLMQKRKEDVVAVEVVLDECSSKGRFGPRCEGVRGEEIRELRVLRSAMLGWVDDGRSSFPWWDSPEPRS